ncbi:MAG: hypothetical protein NTV74_03150 [Euryarchaeota archaeon]|nr:hypothetical protein [Euryarchaeota archaeon]
MRIKIALKVFSFVICLTLLIVVFSQIAIAQSPILQIADTSYHLSQEKSNPQRYYYEINVTFYNSGDSISVPVDIMLYEDGHQTCWPDECHSVSFGRHENKTFTFEWSTPLTYKAIDVVYNPSDANKYKNQYAYYSGNKTIEVSYYGLTDKVKSTPGFEFSIAIIILSIVICLKYFKMKKYN